MTTENDGVNDDEGKWHTLYWSQPELSSYSMEKNGKQTVKRATKDKKWSNEIDGKNVFNDLAAVWENSTFFLAF